EEVEPSQTGDMAILPIAHRPAMQFLFNVDRDGLFVEDNGWTLRTESPDSHQKKCNTPDDAQPRVPNNDQLDSVAKSRLIELQSIDSFQQSKRNWSTKQQQAPQESLYLQYCSMKWIRKGDIETEHQQIAVPNRR